MKYAIDTDILVSYITDAFDSLNTAVGSLPVWEIDLSEADATLQALILSLQESDALARSIQPCLPEASILALPTCLEGHPLVQTRLIMTIHFRSNRRKNNSFKYTSLNYSTFNRTLWT